MSKPPILTIDTGTIEAGDKFRTPRYNHPYVVLHIDREYKYNEIRRRWERHARCMWLDTNIPFDAFFGEGHVRTLKYRKGKRI